MKFLSFLKGKSPKKISLQVAIPSKNKQPKMSISFLEFMGKTILSLLNPHWEMPTMIDVSHNRKVPDVLWGKVGQVHISDGLTAVFREAAERQATW